MSRWDGLVRTEQWCGSYLRCELPLSIFSCHQVLRELLILHCILDTQMQVWLTEHDDAHIWVKAGSRVCTHRLGFLLQIHYLREEVRDLFLLSGGVLGLTSQFLRYGRDLEAGQPWQDRGRDSINSINIFWKKQQEIESDTNLLSSFTQSLTSCCSFSS